MTSIAAPEMRRGSNTTPRMASGRRVSHPNTPHTPQKNPWGDATMPSENVPGSSLPGAATPLAGASTLGRDVPPRQKRVAFAAAGAAVGLLLVAIMVATWSRRTHRPDAPADIAPPAPPAAVQAATPVAETAVLAPPKTAAPAAPEPPSQEDAPAASESPVAGHRAPPAWVHAQHGTRGPAPVAPPPPSVSHAESASVAPAAPPAVSTAPPPPPSAAPKGVVDTVEGREFRTGL